MRPPGGTPVPPKTGHIEFLRLEDHMLKPSSPYPQAPYKTPSSPALDRQALRPDCANCFALCCTAFGFTRSADFAVDKDAGTPCTNLAADFSCTIHHSLRARGFKGCTVFDCFGAGQRVSQDLFGGESWLERPAGKEKMFSAFKAARQLHEMLWYLAEAQVRTFDPEASQRARVLRSIIEKAVGGDPDGLLSLDVQELHAEVRLLLMAVSEEVRASYFATGDDHLDPDLRPRADLSGKDLRSRRLCGADLRSSYLIAADLRGSDLTAVDLLGADLRNARLEGADLSRALFLTQPQINAAQGDLRTLLPADVAAPSHWGA